VFSPPGSNRPSPRRPRDQDEWIAVLVALGTLGGLAGWLILSSFPKIDANDATLTFFAGDETLSVNLQPPSGNDLGPNARIPEVDSQAGGSPQRDTREPVPQSLPESVVEDEAAAASPLPPLPSPDEPASSAQTTPKDAAPLVVPEPLQPENSLAAGLPIVRPALSFADVPVGFWAKPYIDALTARGVLNGLPGGVFEPNRPMTRAELAAQFANAFEMQPSRVAKTFEDVPDDYWAKSPIQETVMMGFMSGYPADVFTPNETLTRLQVLVAIATGLSLPPASDSAGLLQQYPDQTEVPDWAREKIAAAIAADIIAPAQTSVSPLRPLEPATRAEVATLIYRALVYMGKLEPIE
jgi:hypothetical protein